MNPEQKKKAQQNNGKRPPRTNMQLFIILALLALVVGVAYFGKNDVSVKQMEDFRAMALKGHVKKLVVINKEYAEIHLTPEAVQSGDYKGKNEAALPEIGPHYRLDFVD